MSDLGILAAVVFAYSLVSRRLDRWGITGPMVFVGAGILLGPKCLDQVGLELTTGAGLIFAEVTLVIVLFADAARIDLGVLRGNRNLPARLLGIGMPLTIGLGVLAAALLLDEIEFWEAAIVAAVLAPTDAALGKAVVSNRVVPQRIRQAINVESGLNDGLSIPFLFLFVGLAVDEVSVSAQGWLSFLVEQVGIGALVGVGAGLAGGWLIERAVRRKLIAGIFEQLSMLALAVGAWALAGELGGNGFIAAFTGGLAAGRITTTCGQRILDFTEDEGELLQLIVFFIFGVAAIEYLDEAGAAVAVFGLLSLTAIRMLPVAVSLIGTGLHTSSVAFIAWFGPRGLASIILALTVIEEEPALPARDVVLGATAVAVLFSVFAHGLSARPLAAAYGRRMAELEEGAAELVEAPEMPTRGRFGNSP